jgi:hypothetical protein
MPVENKWKISIEKSNREYLPSYVEHNSNEAGVMQLLLKLYAQDEEP